MGQNNITNSSGSLPPGPIPKELVPLLSGPVVGEKKDNKKSENDAVSAHTKGDSSFKEGKKESKGDSKPTGDLKNGSADATTKTVKKSK